MVIHDPFMLVQDVPITGTLQKEGGIPGSSKNYACPTFVPPTQLWVNIGSSGSTLGQVWVKWANVGSSMGQVLIIVGSSMDHLLKREDLYSITNLLISNTKSEKLIKK